MNINAALIDRVSNLAFGCATVSFGIGATSAGAAVGVASGGLVGGAVFIGLAYAARAKADLDSGRVLKRIKRHVRETFRKDHSFGFGEQDELDHVAQRLGELLPSCMLNPTELSKIAFSAGTVGFEETATKNIVASLAQKDDSFKGETLAAEFADTVISIAINAAINDVEYFKKLQSHLMIELACAAGQLLPVLESLDTKVDQLGQSLERLESGQARMENALDALLQTSLKPELISEIAQRLGNTGDANALARGLLHRLQAAEEIIAQGHKTSDIGELADIVNKKVTFQLEKNDLDAAVKEAEMGFAQWESQEAERRKESILQAEAILLLGIKADILRNNADGMAKKVYRHVQLNTSEGKIFDDLRGTQTIYFNHGVNLGDDLFLRVSIDLAKNSLEHAKTKEQKSKAYNDLGMAYRVEAERYDFNSFKLAKFAYEKALKFRPKCKYPDAWAMACTNLGILYLVSFKFGKPQSLEKAINCFKDALEVRSQEHDLYNWAWTTEKLACAYMYKVHDGDDSLIENAIQAFTSALTVLTISAHPKDWAHATINLAEIYRLDKRNSIHDNLTMAIEAFQSTLPIFQLINLPLQWQEIQTSLAGTFLEKYKLGDEQALDKAVDAIRASRSLPTRDHLHLSSFQARKLYFCVFALKAKQIRDLDLIENILARQHLLLEEAQAYSAVAYESAVSEDIIESKEIQTELKKISTV
ncbi:MAG: hypothetical protein ACSHXY_12715 [Alphaproteobacteria bacterium]